MGQQAPNPYFSHYTNDDESVEKYVVYKLNYQIK